METAESIQGRVWRELERISDSMALGRIRELLVTPYPETRPWDYGEPRDYACWDCFGAPSVELVAGEVAQDPERFDRDAMHERLSFEIVGFFDRNLPSAQAHTKGSGFAVLAPAVERRAGISRI